MFLTIKMATKVQSPHFDIIIFFQIFFAIEIQSPYGLGWT
jgi:hypothetical protein